MRSFFLFFLLSSPALASSEVEAAHEAIQGWRFDEAKDRIAKLYAERPGDPIVLALMAEMKFHLSDYQGASHFFELAMKAGAPPELLYDAAVNEAARVETKGYVEAIGDHFIVRHAPGKDELLVPYALETLERARAEIGALVGYTPKARLALEIYPSTASLAAVSTLTRQEIETSGTIALCKWNRLMVTSPRAVMFGYSWRDTIAHELAHLLIGGASKNTAPIWLQEGIAKFVETAWNDAPGRGLSGEQAEMLVKAAKDGTLIPFERMHPSMAKLKSQEETALAFAEVFTFIEFLVAEQGFDGIRLLLARIAEGEPLEGAIASVYRRSFPTLEKAWREQLKHRKIEGKRPKPNIVVKERPDAPDDTLHGLDKEARRFARAADLLFARGRLRAAQTELEKAEAKSRSPMLSARLARVALGNADLEAAETAARRALEDLPDLAGPNLVLAEVAIKRKRPADAKPPLARVIAQNPFDPSVYLLSLAAEGEQVDATTKRQHLRAYELLTGGAGGEPPTLGTGGTIQVEGPPFARVFIEPPDGPAIATGLVTPTPPFGLRPGANKVRLVPPEGPPVVVDVLVERKSEGSQRVVPPGPGS